MRRIFAALLLTAPLAAAALGWYRDVDAVDRTESVPEGFTIVAHKAEAGYDSTLKRAIWGARMDVRIHNRTGRTLMWADTEWAVFAGDKELKREPVRFFKFRRANGPLRTGHKGQWEYFVETGEEASATVTRVEFRLVGASWKDEEKK